MELSLFPVSLLRFMIPGGLFLSCAPRELSMIEVSERHYSYYYHHLCDNNEE